MGVVVDDTRTAPTFATTTQDIALNYMSQRAVVTKRAVVAELASVDMVDEMASVETKPGVIAATILQRVTRGHCSRRQVAVQRA